MLLFYDMNIPKQSEVSMVMQHHNMHNFAESVSNVQKPSENLTTSVAVPI